VKIRYSKILLLVLSSIATLNSIFEYFSLIVNDLIVISMVVLFAVGYRNILKNYYGRFSDSLPFTSMLFLYSILSFLIAKFIDESVLVPELILMVLIFPTLFLGICGAKYFKVGSYGIKRFYNTFLLNKTEEEKFWYDYNTKSGFAKKIYKVLVPIIPGIFAGIAIDFLVLVLLLLIFTDYLFLIVTCLWIVKDYLDGKKISMADGTDQSFKFLQDLLTTKGLFGSALILLGYLTWGLLFINSTNMILGFFSSKIEIGYQFKSLLSLLLLPLPMVATYMFFYQYRISRRFLKFIQIFYKDGSLERKDYPPLPYGGDKVAILSPLLFPAILFSLTSLTTGIGIENVPKLYLEIFLFISISVCIFYVSLLLLTFIKRNRIYSLRIYSLKKDNIRLPFISTSPLIVLCIMDKLYSDGSTCAFYFYAIILMLFCFYIPDLYKRIDRLSISKFRKSILSFLFPLIIVGIPILMPPLQKLRFIFLIAEIAILLILFLDLAGKTQQK